MAGAIVPFYVRVPADLIQLMRAESVAHPFRKPGIVLELRELSADERAVWQRRLNDLGQQCGCTAGAIGLGAFALGSLGYVLSAALGRAYTSPPSGWELWRGGLLFLCGVVVSALSGKLAGLMLASLRFRRACGELRALSQQGA